MARVIIFKRCEMFVGEKERNDEFRALVHQFAPFILEGEITYVETEANTTWGYQNLFESNPDCELVFTAQNDSYAQVEATKRGIMTFEWTCFGAKKFVPITVSLEDCESFKIFHKDHHHIQVSA